MKSDFKNLGCMEEYSALRNEILSHMEQERTTWIAMVTIYVAMFVLAIENSIHILPLTYIVLIPFQSMLNLYEWSIQKVSTYIRIFYEKDNPRMNWETMHVFPPYLKYRERMGNGCFVNTGLSVILGALSTFSFIVNRIYVIYIGIESIVSVIDIFLMALSIILLIIIIFVNFKFNKRYESYLKIKITEYKKKIENTSR